MYPIERPVERATQLKLDAFAINAKKKSERASTPPLQTPSA